MDDDDSSTQRTVSLAPPDEPPADEFAPLRTQCDGLLAIPTVEKDVALGILRLLHSAQTMLLELRHAKDQEADRLRHELELLRVTHRSAERVDTLAADVAQLGKWRHEDSRRVSEAVDTHQGTAQALHALQAVQAQAGLGKRR